MLSAGMSSLCWGSPDSKHRAGRDAFFTFDVGFDADLNDPLVDVDLDFEGGGPIA